MKPFVTCVRDYHDFRIIVHALEHAGFGHIEYKEIGCGLSKLTGNFPYGMYHACFFVTGTPEEEIKPVISYWKDEICA